MAFNWENYKWLLIAELQRAKLQSCQYFYLILVNVECFKFVSCWYFRYFLCRISRPLENSKCLLVTDAEFAKQEWLVFVAKVVRILCWIGVLFTINRLLLNLFSAIFVYPNCFSMMQDILYCMCENRYVCTAFYLVLNWLLLLLLMSALS